MTIFDRFTITVVAAGAGLCGVALALSPEVAAAPLITGGGYACVHTSSGDGAGAAAGSDRGRWCISGSGRVRSG